MIRMPRYWGFQAPHVALLAHETLGDADTKAALLSALRMLLLRGAEFKRGAVERASALISEMARRPMSRPQASRGRSLSLSSANFTGSATRTLMLTPTLRLALGSP